MEVRNIETLQPNPNNDRDLTDRGRELLLHAMSLGDSGVFLITPEGMIINGNNRFNLRSDAHWDNKNVNCRILSYGQDEQGFYAIVDGEIVTEGEVIPHHYISVDALYKAFSLISNGEAAVDNQDAIANKWDTWGLNADNFQVNFFPPKSLEETLKDMEKKAAAQKYQLIIECQSIEDLQQKENQIAPFGFTYKKKI